MGASVGGGRGGGKRRMNAEINVVPYIDVMLVLLIIFMVTAPLLTQGVDVELPQTEAAPLVIDDEPLTLSVNRNGEMYLNRGEKIDAPLTDEEVVRIAGAIARNAKSDKGQMVLVEGDGQADYKYVAKAMTLLQTAGIKKIGFVTDPVDIPAKGTK
ncbi:cell division and transport-associated protein TolR [Panacagrimonas perspica]|uniref:Tol-Pal system protein TolR n=1 Tax=Panacagrimonas perspica TaxID=381431 RepID=A0A4S3K9J5_9GAMM|nr:protein TolR [Panacagrimonas perspica]TDU31967.1 cell division and transport-associated protein TolR [Panacagrimonas perspica]THD04494.1 protein TolR [Panacagrimonas perspica]